MDIRIFDPKHTTPAVLFRFLSDIDRETSRKPQVFHLSIFTKFATFCQVFAGKFLPESAISRIYGKKQVHIE